MASLMDLDPSSTPSYGILNDPMMGMAQGLLSASGASRLPVSFGQAMGQGLAGAQQVQSGALQRQAQSQQIAIQQYQMARSKIMQQLLENAYRQTQGSQAAPGPQPQQGAVSSLPGIAGGQVNAPPGAPAGMPIGQPQQPPQQQPGGMNSMYPQIGPMDPTASLLQWMTNPSGALSAWSTQNSPSDFQKIERLAAAGDPLAKAQIEKLNYIAPVNLRAKGMVLDPITHLPIAINPDLPEGMIPNFAPGTAIPTGAQYVPGAFEGIQRNAYAAGAPKVVEATGPQGQRITTTAGSLPGYGGGYIPRSYAPTTNAPPVNSPSTGTSGITGPTLGQAAAYPEMGKAGAKRYNDTLQLAAESPMRINVLDNIIDLSQSGVATGNGADWQNKILGYAANSPVLGKLMSGAKDNVGKFQELQKFTYQNALRNWQAAGGTGTDAQMLAASHANPNDTLFPNALQAIARWGKASELALQSKANAQQQWLKANNGDVSNQNEFETEWRQNFDPRIYQIQLMSPQQAIAYRKTLSASDAAEVQKDIAYGRQHGWLQ